MNGTAARCQSHGFTLVELCTAAAIGATLVSQAVPALGKLRQEQQLRARSDALASDLRFARSEADRLGESVFFRVSGKGANACYLLYTGTRNDCDCASGQAVCKTASSGVIKAQRLSSDQPLSLRSNAETLEFQRRQSLVTQTGSIDLSLSNGTGIRQDIAITGRVRSYYTGSKISGVTKCA